MSAPDTLKGFEQFEAIIDRFGLSTNRAMNEAIHQGPPDNLDSPLFALALALGAIAAGTQKAAELVAKLEPYGFADAKAVRELLALTMFEHYERKTFAETKPTGKPN